MKIHDATSQPPFDLFRSIPAAGEPRREALDRLRCWLLQTVACEWHLEMLLDLASGRTTYEELASAAGMNRGSLWRLVRKAHERIRLAALAEVAAGALHGGTGFTLDPQSARLIEAPDGDCFAVGMLGTDSTLAAPTAESILDFLGTHARCLLRRGPRQVYLGGWMPTPTSARVHLELCVLFDDEAGARAFGRQQRQSRIYNLHTGEDVRLQGGEKGRAAA